MRKREKLPGEEANERQPLSPLAYVHLPACPGMPSFKDRFRSSRKSKKGKEPGADDTVNGPTASTSLVVDRHTGWATTHSSHYPTDHGECPLTISGPMASARPVSRTHDRDRYRLSETDAVARTLSLSLSLFTYMQLFRFDFFRYL